MADGAADRFDGEVLEEVGEELKEPDMYKVVLFNDDYTTKEFVVEVLRTVFHKEAIEATKSTDQKTVGEYMRKAWFETVLGKIRFALKLLNISPHTTQ